MMAAWDREGIHEYLSARGWVRSHTTVRRSKTNDSITWWERGGWLYPQFLALDLERKGWVNILETL